MKWILAVFIILDSIFQLFAEPFSSFWSTYYDVLHYGVLMALSVYFYKISRDKLLMLFTVYFGFILILVLTNYRINWIDYIDRISTSSPVYFVPFFVISILIYFIYNKIRNGEV